MDGDILIISFLPVLFHEETHDHRDTFRTVDDSLMDTLITKYAGD